MSNRIAGSEYHENALTLLIRMTFVAADVIMKDIHLIPAPVKEKPWRKLKGLGMKITGNH
jgi:hypothetical protein